MKRSIILSAAAAFITAAPAQTVGYGYPHTPVAFTSVKITPNSFWGDRIKAARETTIPLAFSKCESEGRYANFAKAAHPSDTYDVGSFMGFSFDDTDVYKTIEGASYLLQTYPDKRMVQYIDSVLDIVAAAQEPDGYLYTARTINPKKPHPWAGKRRWEAVENLSHELYNLGHMADAACAHYQATGSTKFLDIARRYAKCVIREVGPGEGQACVVPGHQIAEMALARMYVLTGDRSHLDEAKFFLDMRGRTSRKNAYSQSHKPVTEQYEAVGHAVRAGYMYAGMADVAALTGDSSYIKAIDRICDNIIGRKYYLTGGVGARHAGEAFGANYELPNLTAYNETCAAISMVYLFQRMFLFRGESRYIDCLERTLYNGVISGMSVDGGRFFYPNPLASDGRYAFNADGNTTRQPWFGCACCPSNISRFIPSLPGYIYAVKGDCLYVNLFAANTATVKVAGRDVTLQQETQYPWDGDIAIRVLKNRGKAFTMKVRIPGWVRGQVVPSDLYSYADGVQTGYSVTVNGEKADGTLTADGYMTVSRKWKRGDVVRVHFDMQPRTVTANAKVADDRGKIAVERGPLVYCAEQADNAGFNSHHVLLSRKPQFTVNRDYKIVNTENGGQAFGVTAITVDNAQEAAIADDGTLTARDVRLTLIPYYAWNHRGAGYMDVWMAKDFDGLAK